MGIDIEVGHRHFDAEPTVAAHVDLMEVEEAEHLVTFREGDDYNLINIYLTGSELFSLHEQISSAVKARQNS